MKPQFENIDVECWEHAGKLGGAAPAICLFHSKVELGRVLLGALDELRTEAQESRRTLTLKPSLRKHACSTLRLRLVPARIELQVLNISRDGNVATLEMTGIGLAILYDRIQTWCNGGEDFGVSPQHSNLKRKELGSLDRASGELWFWGPTMLP